MWKFIIMDGDSENNFKKGKEKAVLLYLKCSHSSKKAFERTITKNILNHKIKMRLCMDSKGTCLFSSKLILVLEYYPIYSNQTYKLNKCITN